MKLEVRDLYKSFGPKEVLKGISFTAESGRALGLLGRNGAGKTTAIRIMMGVLPADSGEVLLDGKKLDINRVKVGYLPEERGLYPKKPIMEQLVYFGQLRGMTASAAKKSAQVLVERLGMQEYMNKKRKLMTLSKGNQQKIQLAAALITDPDIVILDEPFSGLDPVNAMLLEEIVRERIQKGNIVLFSSHQMNYIEEFCDNIAILNGGQIALSGGIREIKRGYDRSVILIDTQQPERVVELCRKNPEIVSSTDVAGNVVRVQMTTGDRKAELLKAVGDARADIDDFRVYEPSLNDIFVKYTEGGV
ncbi:MAG TPA: ATP-binding cassette domain-containing protein [Candidatus Onthovicinus excrementipullorum]|nr:ATP-binding cassette domain-containing protein [Candidatus Onthovicinus excrementipullorum]